jgi:hypothetical protein
MIHGFFHIALIHNGNLIAAELHGQLLQSGLYKIADKITVCLVGDLQQACELTTFFMNFPKYDVEFCGDLEGFEWVTLKKLQQDPGDLNFYIHTKGASNCRLDVPARIQRNITAWRHLMSNHVINNWCHCVDLLEIHSSVGPLFTKQHLNLPCTQGYYTGNFWWARRDHIESLVPITQELSENRNHAEGWIGTGLSLYSLYDSDDFDLYDFENKHSAGWLYE